MKRFALAAALALAVVSPAGAQNSPIGDLSAAQGEPFYLGSYNATTTAKTNAEVGTPFAITGEFLKHKVLLLHNTGSVTIRILPVATSTGSAFSPQPTPEGSAMAGWPESAPVARSAAPSPRPWPLAATQ